MNRKRKLHTFTEWNIRFTIQNMDFSVDITKNNGIVPDRHGSNTVFKSGLVAFSDFFRVNYFNILITRFAFIFQTLFKMVMWVATSEGYKIDFWPKKLLYFGLKNFLEPAMFCHLAVLI